MTSLLKRSFSGHDDLASPSRRLCLHAEVSVLRRDGADLTGAAARCGNIEPQGGPLGEIGGALDLIDHS